MHLQRNGQLHPNARAVQQHANGPRGMHQDWALAMRELRALGDALAKAKVLVVLGVGCWLRMGRDRSNGSAAQLPQTGVCRPLCCAHAAVTRLAWIKLAAMHHNL